MTVSYNTIKQVNSAFLKTKVPSPVGVFCGSTSGIGENLAYQFAKTTVDPTIYIVGRNVTRGSNVQNEILQLNPSAKVTFLKYDLGLIKQAKEFASFIKEKETKINLLSLTQGELLIQGRTETLEGLDQNMALNYYGRWTIVSSLIDLMQSAAKGNEPARVLTVVEAGFETNVDLDDLEIKKNYTFSYAMRAGPTYNSLACLYFARKYPDIAFIHTHPGQVSTRIGRSLPFYLKGLAKLVFLFTSTPEKSGEYHIYAGYTCNDFASGCHLLDPNLTSVFAKGEKLGRYTNENQYKLLKHTKEIIDRVTNH